MTPSTPEEALAEARRRAGAARTAGEYADADRMPVLGRPEPTDLARLHEWALIEIPPEEIRSTRRLGKPITFLKRVLGRLLVQHFNEVTAQQSRFNLEMLAYIIRL
ncbi:MAG: hypothetical protein QOK04_125, partial [Solirubrobacteraceae bacterium]|nr:hypothetical protein [Solirubrobacteraceae bacterium]